MTTKEWKEHAYPLKSIKIQLQGTRHTSIASLLSQLKEIIAKIESGDNKGESSDDDFGYKFHVMSDGNTSIFDEEQLTQNNLENIMPTSKNLHFEYVDTQIERWRNGELVAKHEPSQLGEGIESVVIEPDANNKIVVGSSRKGKNILNSVQNGKEKWRNHSSESSVTLFAFFVTVAVIEVLASNGMVDRRSCYAGLSASAFIYLAKFFGFSFKGGGWLVRCILIAVAFLIAALVANIGLML